MDTSQTMRENIAKGVGSALSVCQAMQEDALLHEQLAELAQWCLDALREGRKIIFAGNGGSFADSQHLAAEFVSRLEFDRAPLAAIALSTNSSCMSAIGNDYAYDQVFSRELSGLTRAKDVAIPITTSGSSSNIRAAVAVAKELGVRTVGSTGEGGGRLGTVCACLRVPSGRTERIQEGYILLGHILCALVETGYFKGGAS